MCSWKLEVNNTEIKVLLKIMMFKLKVKKTRKIYELCLIPDTPILSCATCKYTECIAKAEQFPLLYIHVYM